MLNDLTTTLKTILADTTLPGLIHNVDVAFDRPAESYATNKTTINLFLYDIRESTELRNNEPIVERQFGIATIRRPPLRISCSYLVTAWIEAGVLGEDAILKQHELLSEVLRVFAGMPVIPLDKLTGGLATQPYPIPLEVLQTDLVRNPAEFWSALGGKLRPSFTLTATLALEPLSTPITAPEVTTKKVVVRDTAGGPEGLVYEMGGTVRATGTGVPMPEVEVSIPALGRSTLTDAAGHYVFGGLAAGSLSVAAAKTGYLTVTKMFQVPGNSRTAFDIGLSVTP